MVLPQYMQDASTIGGALGGNIGTLCCMAGLCWYVCRLPTLGRIMNSIAQGLADDDARSHFRAAVSSDPAAASTASATEVILRSSGRLEQANNLRDELDAAARRPPRVMPRVQSAPAIQTMQAEPLARTASFAQPLSQNMPAGQAPLSLAASGSTLTVSLPQPAPAGQAPSRTISRPSRPSIAVPRISSVAERSHEGSPGSESPAVATPHRSPERRLSGDEHSSPLPLTTLRSKFMPRRWGRGPPSTAGPASGGGQGDASSLRAEEGRMDPPSLTPARLAQMRLVPGPRRPSAPSRHGIEMIAELRPTAQPSPKAAIHDQGMTSSGSGLPSRPGGSRPSRHGIELLAESRPTAQSPPEPAIHDQRTTSSARGPPSRTRGSRPPRQIEVPGGSRTVPSDLAGFHEALAARPRSPRGSNRSGGSSSAAPPPFSPFGSRPSSGARGGTPAVPGGARPIRPSRLVQSQEVQLTGGRPGAAGRGDHRAGQGDRAPRSRAEPRSVRDPPRRFVQGNDDNV